MRIFLVFYFTICVISDPWVDGPSMTSSLEKFSPKIQQTIATQHQQDSHHHNDFPENCADHSCHLGHCGIVVGDRLVALSRLKTNPYTDYKQLIPDPHLMSVKRPPKFSA